MANFLGGVIPTVKVSSSSSLNSLANNLIETTADSVVNVALGSVLPAELGKVLGVSPSSFDDVLGSAITPGIIATGQAAISDFITGTIVNSEALGPFGPLAGNILNTVVQDVTGNLIGNIFGSATSSGSSRWFPGAGDEPDAYYNGSLFTGGPVGSDVVFSIKSAETVAANLAFKESFNPSKAELESWNSVTLDSPSSPIGSLDLSNSKLFWNPTTESAGTSESFSGFKSAFKDGSTDFYGLDSKIGSLGSGSILPPLEAWNFICAPEEISWNSEMQVEKVQVFGSNQPPVVAGSKSMRDLNISNALVEGFTRMKTVEGKIAKLESLMNFSIDSSRGYVKVPVFYVTANDKKYGLGLDGKDGGYFIIKSVNVKESMRDLRGDATRGIVDVTFTQVPPYQVDSGRDIASKSTLGQTSILGSVAEKQAQVLSAAAKAGLISEDSTDKRTKKGSVKAGGTTPTSGSGAPAAKPDKKEPPGPAEAGVLPYREIPNPPSTQSEGQGG